MMKFGSSTSVLTSFLPVDEKGCILISLAVYAAAFHRLDENRRTIKTLLKALSEVYTGRMKPDEFCYGH